MSDEYQNDDEQYDDEVEDETDEDADETAPFNAKVYADELASTLGVTPDPDSLAKCYQCSDARSINKIMLNLPKIQAKPVELQSSDTEFFRTMVSVTNNPEVLTVQRSMDNELGRALDYMRQADQRLREAGKYRAKYELLVGTKGVDMTEEIMKVLSDGWYEYDRAKTERMNREEDQRQVWFTTKPITLAYYKQAAGIDLRVNMGRYKVAYMPLINRIQVHEYTDNTKYREYYHPHVGNEGDVCWGNGYERVTKALKEYKVSDALAILRTLLQTYNDESPYASLQDFAFTQDPLLRAKRPAHMQQFGSKSVWIYNRHMPNSDVEVMCTQPSGHYFPNRDYSVSYPASRIAVYRMMYKDTGDRVEATPYYVRTKNGRFVALNADRIIYWPEASEPLVGQPIIGTAQSGYTITVNTTSSPF